MDKNKNAQYIDQMWDDHIIPTLIEYIKIPNKSPQFDPNWRENGYMDQAVKLIADWCQKHSIDDMTLDIIQLEERTPVILIDIPGQNNDTVLLYGHLDKQPEMTGWEEGLAPWTPILRGDKLYGRGAADDGYAAFASLTAVKSLREQNIPHSRCVILIEASEESGSDDLPFYVETLKDRLGKPNLVICLDSGCGNYDQLWKTTSLRGLMSCHLKIKVLTEGVHSGNGSGIVPSCFSIFQQIIERAVYPESDDILLEELQVQIPDERIQQANQAAEVLGDAIWQDLPFADGVSPREGSATDLLLNRTWRPALSIVGCDGVPDIKDAGNVTLPELTFKLSMRLPPTCDPEVAADAFKSTLEKNPPFNAKITCDIHELAAGWNAPSEAKWLTDASNQASMDYFSAKALCIGEGGSIPFMGMLGEKFPEAQFFITGVLGPKSNAHGPNEFLHIPMGKKLTACVAHVIAEQFKESCREG